MKRRKPKAARKRGSRDYDSKLFKEFRQKVLKRDDYTCQMPSCDCKNRRELQVHHIRIWAHNPAMRFAETNGITLCKECHKRVTKKETYYQELFLRIVRRKYGD